MQFGAVLYRTSALFLKLSASSRSRGCRIPARVDGEPGGAGRACAERLLRAGEGARATRRRGGPRLASRPVHARRRRVRHPSCDAPIADRGDRMSGSPARGRAALALLLLGRRRGASRPRPRRFPHALGGGGQAGRHGGGARHRLGPGRREVRGTHRLPGRGAVRGTRASRHRAVPYKVALGPVGRGRHRVRVAFDRAKSPPGARRRVRRLAASLEPAAGRSRATRRSSTAATSRRSPGPTRTTPPTCRCSRTTRRRATRGNDDARVHDDLVQRGRRHEHAGADGALGAHDRHRVDLPRRARTATARSSPSTTRRRTTRPRRSPAPSTGDHPLLVT